MEIRIYRPELKRAGQIENQTSLIWTRKFYEPGNFELHAPITEKNLKLLVPGYIVSKKGSAEAGVIESIEKEESDIKNEITVKGRFLSSYTDRRLIKNTVNFSGKIEIAMRQLIEGVEPIPDLELGDLNGFEETVEFQATMKNLQEYLTKLAKTGNIGYRIRPDFTAHKLYFETYKGNDRTLSQGINSRVIFSEKYNNLNNAIYKYNDKTHKTKAIVGGPGEGSERIYVEVGSGEGLDLREIFVDAKDITGEGLTEEELLAAMTQRGQEALNEKVIVESLECETEPEINFAYKIDYDLGDVVTVKKKGWGLYMNKRITEAQEIYEYGAMCVVPTLGDPLPEKIEWGE